MALTLYRRHSASCVVAKSAMSARAKRKAMNCTCPIWIYGHTATGIFPRQSTGFTDLAEAEALRNSLGAQGKDEAIHGPRIDDCVRQYLESREHELGSKTRRQHEHLLELFQRYMAGHNVYFMRQITVDHLERFKVEGLRGLADTSKGTVVAKMRAFLRDAFRREWILKPLAEQVRGHIAVYEEKMPYTDEEVTKILAEGLNLNGGRNGYSKHPMTFRLLLDLMLEMGLRVSDAVRFDPAKLTKGTEGMWIYPFAMMKRKRTQKPKIVEAYLSNRLKAAIERCEWLTPQFPFLYGNQPESAVRERMATIGVRCGVEDCRPHRLRDTFAVRTLLAGVSLEDVSRLLGHSSVKITESYYARWVPSRKVRLERIVAQSLVDTRRNARRNR